MRRHLTFSNAVALLALFVALGGSSYAALKISGKNVRDSSLTGRDLKNRSVKGADVARNTLTGVNVRNRSLTGADIKDGSLSAKDLAKGVGVAGPQGPAGAAGATGPQGPAGPAGPQGPAGQSVLAGGETVYGTITASFPSGGTATETVYVGASLPVPAPVAIDDEHVLINGAADDPEDRCKGSASSPSAPAGHVCVYLVTFSNLNTSTLESNAHRAGGSSSSPLGFTLHYQRGDHTTTSHLLGRWAYTAP